MASVEPPAPTYKPNLPPELISEGMLSIAQLEAIVYAGQAHEQFLPNGERRGFFIGDGTGVGKGREIAGIILDNMRQGRNKALWVSFNEGLINDARRDFSGVGGNDGAISWQGKTKPADKIVAKDGVLFTSYTTLKSAERRQAGDTDKTPPRSRLDQIVEWLGADFDGVIVFDEAHSMGNIVPMRGKRGMKKPSLQALAGADLQKRLPKARVVYVSATGATEVSNLGYASRLGLWGEGTPFSNVAEFVSKIAEGGVAAMELISRDMKALGMYIARSLSFDGVTYQRIDHELTPLQTDMYNEMAKAWQGVLRNVNSALSTTGGDKNANAKSAALSAFWGSHQRFFNQVITSMQTPTVIDDMRSQIEAGNAIVVQLVNTNEATQEREVKKSEAAGKDLEELDFTPRQILMDYVRNSFPIQAYSEQMDANGNIVMLPVEDAAGNPVFDKDAIAMRDQLLETLEQIRVPGNPIDEIINAFGTEAVGEVTGRGRRFITKRGEDGSYRIVEEKRGKNAAHNDAAAFQNDKKKVLVFSQAGGTGYSFHADNTARNRRKRIHYILQAGWRADATVQGFGRSHRTNQATEPTYMLPTTNLKAQKRFISSIARRLDQLGALTKGQRQAASQGLFTAADNLESQYAEAALAALFDDMYRGKTSLDFNEITTAMGLTGLVDAKTGGLNATKIPEIPQFLNRLLSLETHQQDAVFSEFESRLDEVVNFAIQSGTYDTGLQTIRAQSIRKASDEIVYHDSRTGAETRYVEVDVTNPIEYLTAEQAKAWAKGYEGKFVGWMKDAKGGWFGLADLGYRFDSNGNTLRRGVVLRKDGERRYVDNADEIRQGWRYVGGGRKEVISTSIADEASAMDLLNEQVAAAPKTKTERKRLIVGAILPIWDRVQGNAKIVRLQTDAGERMIGRMMTRADADRTLKNLGVGSSVSKMSNEDLLSAIKNGATAVLANGWTISTSVVSGQQRIEIRSKSGYFTTGESEILRNQGAFLERIGWQERAFIPRGEGEPVFARVVTAKPVVDLIEKDGRGKNLAEQERLVYAVKEPDGITGDLFQGTTQDLFAGTNHALPTEARSNLSRQGQAPKGNVRSAARPAARVLAVRQAPDAPGVYHVSTQLVTVGHRPIPVDRIRTTNDAAAAFAYLSKHAVEHYDAIVTDRLGKPLAVIGSFKGALTQTSVYPSTVVSELSRIDGAAHLWAAHNHPSGTPDLSAADKTLSAEFEKVLHGSGVQYHGLFAMANKSGSPGVVAYRHTEGHVGDVDRSLPATRRVPIVERELIDERNPGDYISSYAVAEHMVPQIAGRNPGILFLDALHRPAAYVPFTGEELGHLKKDGRLMRLFRSASQANAGAAIVAMPNGEVTHAQVSNVITALSGIEVRVLDAIEYTHGSGRGSSLSALGRMPGPGNVVFSQRGVADGMSTADRAVFDMAMEGKTADEILSFISQSSRRPFNRVLASALRRAGLSSAVSVDILLHKDSTFSRDGRTNVAAAAYDPKSDTVSLFTPRDAERHFLHELVHAATLKAIAAGGPAANRMRALFRHVQKSGRLTGQYGLTSVDEFVTEAFTNPEFQEGLKSIPAPAGSALKSAWQWFVRIVARAIGIKTQASETALDRALSAGAALMQENMALSATGNRGTFDPSNPDIRYSVASGGRQTQHNAPPVAPGNLWQAAKAKAAALLTPERLDKVIYELQDKYIDLRRIRDYIREIGGTITDLNDAYLGEELYHKRLAHRTQDFMKDEVRPLLADMKAQGVSMQEFETFLHARHAPEANAEMARRNPNQQEIDAGRLAAARTVHALERQLANAQANGTATAAIEQALNDSRGELVKWNGAQAFRGTEQERLSLSGMTDQAAAAVMAGLSPERRAALDALAARVDAINAGTLRLLEGYGLMSRASLDEWRRTYQYYIPLHRDEAHPDSTSHPIGQGFSVKGEAAKRRTGSNQKVTNILGHIAMQREAALTRGEKNRVMLKLYLMARQNPLPDVWKVGSVPMVDTIDKATGFVKSVADPLYRNRPNVVTLRIAGKDVSVTMNEHNPQALRMAQALKNLDVDDLHYIIPVVGKMTRYFAAINTQYNPIFGVINLMRDAQEAALNLSTTELAGKQKQVMRDALGILGEVVKNKGRMPTGGRWGALFDEFNEVGGTTGYRDLYLNAEDRAKSLLSELKAMDRGQFSRAAHAIADWLSDYNEAMENAVRLAAYKSALDQGLSKERAASLAKNLTVNFNRKGRQTRELGALYAFFNASVQGTARMAQTLAGPAGKKIMAGGVLLGALNALLGIAAMGGGDGEDDEYAKIPQFVKERSIIIPVGKQDYIAIPMPLGFQFLPNIGRLAVEMAVYKDKTAGKQMAILFTVLADAASPLGGSSPPMQIISPTVMDPFVALAQNKDWTGRPIYIENFNALNPEPGTKRAKDSATPWAKGFAEAINAITGGTQYVAGGWSPTPDQIDYVIGQLTGGIGREAGKVAATAAAPFTGEELPPYKIPLVGRLYGSTGGTSGQSETFYERIKQANAAENEIKGRLKDGIGIADFLRENPHAIELAALGNAAERQVRELRGIRRGIVSRGEPDATARAREINERMAEVMRNFNRQAGTLQ